MKRPHLAHEKRLWKKNYLVIGIDEVGRGAFAGPLVLGGVIFQPTHNRQQISKLLSFGINDSKKLKKGERERLDSIIKTESFVHICESVSVPVINSIGIGKAFHVGVRKLVKRIMYYVESKFYTKYHIPNTKYFLLIDAFSCKYVHGVGLKNQTAIVKGDEISLSIAAASIIAKVYRDSFMTKLALKYPRYGFEKHVGYGTKAHREAIIKHGLTKIHRTAFIHS